MEFRHYCSKKPLKIVFLVIIPLFILSMLASSNWQFTTLLPASHLNPPRCRVLDLILSGTWKSRPMTFKQNSEMRKFLEVARNEIHLPRTLQRRDRKCGDFYFPGIAPWFRALCDQYGPTPCCDNNKCVAKEADKCRCENCYDTRQVLHAEYSDWLPSDQRCHIKKYNKDTACELLTGKTVFLSGDSLMRHIYTAFLLLLRNNTIDGAMNQNVTKDMHDKCTGMFMFTEKICRLQLDNTTSDLCGGKFELIFKHYYKLGLSDRFVAKVSELMTRKKVLIIADIGLHANLNHRPVMDKYIAPALKVIQKHKGAQLLIAPPHRPGLLKSSYYGQGKIGIEQYIKHMEKELKPHNVSIFNTFYITHGIESYDGVHFGLGINMLKAQLLLNYIQELDGNNNW